MSKTRMQTGSEKTGLERGTFDPHLTAAVNRTKAMTWETTRNPAAAGSGERAREGIWLGDLDSNQD